MSKKTRRTRRMRNMLLVVSMMLVVAMASVGVTVAWLTDKTEAVTNTFTASDVDITLTETTGNEYKMVPGTEISKDPKVKVEDDSENCYLFVKLTEACTVEKTAASGETPATNYSFSEFLTYAVADGWNALDDEAGVYWREVKTTDETKEFSVLSGDKLTVNNTVTKAMMDKLNGTNNPKLTVQAFACQTANVADAAAAWSNIEK